MVNFAHRGIINYENTVKGVLEVFARMDSSMGVEIDIRYNTALEIVLCHSRENMDHSKNATLYQLLHSLNDQHYHDKHLMIDIKAFGVQCAKQLARSTWEIIQSFPSLYKNMHIYLCSFNEYCVYELLVLLQNQTTNNIQVGVITTGIPIGMFTHLEGITFVSMEYGILCEEIIKEMKQKHLEVYSWVVNDCSMQDLMKSYKVNGIIQDVHTTFIDDALPRDALAHLGRSD